MATNYAQILGIQNKWAPIVFAVIYFLVMLWYMVQAVRRHGWVYSFLAFFSALRVVSFCLRAAMANNFHNDAFNRSMAIAYMVLYNVASSPSSSREPTPPRPPTPREDRSRAREGRSFLPKMMGGFRKGRIVELLLLASVVIGAVGGAYALDANVSRTTVGNKLNEAGTYILLVVTVLIALLTFAVVRIERSLRGTSTAAATATHHHLILLLITVLLLLRILFYTATVHQRASGQPTPASAASSSIRQSAQGNEHLWYPLAALAELLVVLLFLAPGLVPIRSLIMRGRHAGAGNNEKVNGTNGHGQGTTGAGYTAGDNAATGGLGAADHVHGGGVWFER
ncbi:hypothetical protein B0H13DRAFT_2673330 [Mycena leptocephala]|nr:hypothetical protein B0H13DRAFT_2673330 [Mycena leptocephala]